VVVGHLAADIVEEVFEADLVVFDEEVLEVVDQVEVGNWYLIIWKERLYHQ
jgi:hypothetical protein